MGGGSRIKLVLIICALSTSNDGAQRSIIVTGGFVLQIFQISILFFRLIGMENEYEKNVN